MSINIPLTKTEGALHPPTPLRVGGILYRCKIHPMNKRIGLTAYPTMPPDLHMFKFMKTSWSPNGVGNIPQMQQAQTWLPPPPRSPILWGCTKPYSSS